MTSGLATLTQLYSLALEEYLQGGGEATLLKAYELGRTALGLRLGVLEMASLHQEALVSTLLQMLAPQDSQRIARRSAEFFVESVAPFEMSRRGVQEANAHLRDANTQLEQRVQATQEQLQELERMERLKDEFVSIASHELRAPLTSIQGALGLVQARDPGEIPPQVTRLVDVAYRNTQRLVRLVNDMLDLQKIESGGLDLDLRPLEIASIVEQALEANQAYGQQFGVSLVLAKSLPGAWVRADSDRLVQVLTNLLSNAAKFSLAGQTVEVAVSRQPTGIRVSVADHGPGVPDDFKERIFGKFARSESPEARRVSGSGLGLNISRAIIERLGGHIDFVTSPGRGSTFFFDLPEWRQPERSAPAAGPGSC